MDLFGKEYDKRAPLAPRALALLHRDGAVAVVTVIAFTLLCLVVAMQEPPYGRDRNLVFPGWGIVVLPFFAGRVRRLVRALQAGRAVDNVPGPIYSFLGRVAVYFPAGLAVLLGAICTGMLPVLALDDEITGVGHALALASGPVVCWAGVRTWLFLRRAKRFVRVLRKRPPTVAPAAPAPTAERRVLYADLAEA